LSLATTRRSTDDRRQLALRYLGAEEGAACEGTAIAKRTTEVGSKAFSINSGELDDFPN
jgi:hypothetical protein